MPTRARGLAVPTDRFELRSPGSRLRPARVRRRRGPLRWMVAALALVGVVVTVGPSEARANARPTRHTVVSGESLWTIAHEHGCRVDDLRDANALSEGPLLVGTRLKIPACKGKPHAKSGSRNKGKARTHEVAAGETLSGIAARYDTTIEDLRARNELDGDLIRPGQVLQVGAGDPPIPIRLVAGQSVGRPQRGSLHDGTQLPHSPQYYRRRPEWVFGASHVVDYTRRAIAEVNREHPRVHRLAIGDISAPDGGVLPGHGSHQSGRDIDLGLYFRSVPSGYPSEFVPADDGKLDAEATWTLVYALYRASKSAGGPVKIFLDYEVQGQLYKAARKAGVSRGVLREIFQYPEGRYTRERLVKHEPKHDDHLHVRFGCPPKDDGCR